MEENSNIHMETDVSSTTDDAVDTQEVTGSNGQVEMTITVEKVNEEEPTSNMETDSHPSHNVLSRRTPEKASPSKIQQNIVTNSPSKAENPKPIHKSPAKTESPQKVTIVSPLKTTVVTSPDHKANNADSSTKSVTLVSPTKVKIQSKDFQPKRPDEDKNQVTQSSPPSQKKTIFIIKKSPIKDASIVKSPVEPKPFSHLVELADQDKPVEESSITDTSDKRAFQVIQRSPPYIKSPPIKLVRKPLTKDLKVQDTKEIKVIDPPKTIKIISNTVNKEISDDKPKKEDTHPSTSKDFNINTVNNNGETDSITNKPKLKEAELEKPAAISMEIPMDVLEAEASNDSQLSSTTSEKEHNKSISRELKSLINSAKESKIISECNQLTSKTRKSRINLDTSLNNSVDSDSVHDDKKEPQSQDKTQEDKLTLKRSMRSQNPDFVTKCKQFLNSVTSKTNDESQSDSETEDLKRKQKLDIQIPVDSVESTPKKKKLEEPVVHGSCPLRSDPYCWRCHWPLEAEPSEKQPVHPPLHCSVCVRSYHGKCMTVVERKISTEKNWVCPDCLQILHAESGDSRSPSMKKISLAMLCDLLKFALERMEALNGVEPFLQPVDRTAFPDYDKVVVHPMDLSQMRQNITDGHYGSTEAFIADAQWILHNSILFNACEQNFPHSKLTQAARALVRTGRAEMAEIETCPECYAGAHSRNLTYFTDVCSTPHMILWAKLKGFPYWPAKAVAVNNGMVDVRFFGQHDKSWVPVRDCYLYSEKDPNTTKHKKLELMQCRQEAELHIRNICRKYGRFVYAPFKTTFDHTNMTEQLKMMIPSFEGEINTVTDKKAFPIAKDNRRSTSKSSKSSFNDDDNSECEETPSKSSTLQKADESTNISDESTSTISTETASSSKTTSPLITAKEEPKDKPEKAQPVKEAAAVAVEDKKMDIDLLKTNKPDTTPSRKRRRSTFPDHITTESTSQKKKKQDDKSESNEEKKRTPGKEDKKITTGPSKEDKKLTPGPSKEDKKPGPSEEDKKLTPGPSKEDKKHTPGPNKGDKKPTPGPSKEKEEKKSTESRSKEEKNEKTKDESKPEAEVEAITNISENNKEINTNTESEDKNLASSVERALREKEGLRVTPIKLVAIPRVNKQTPKLFTTAKITKVTSERVMPKTPSEEDKSLNTSTPSSSKRSKVSKADKFIITNSDEKELITRSSRRNSRSNKSLTSTPKDKSVDKSRERSTDKKPEKSIDKTTEKQTENVNEASSSRDKSKKKESDKSLIKVEVSKPIKGEKETTKKSEDDDVSLALIARDNRNSNSGLPTISNVISLSTATDKSSSTTTKTTTNAKTKQTPTTSKSKRIEITVEANSDSSIFTPTSSGNIGNMKEAVTKLQKLRNDSPSESLVGRVGVKAFARMTSPDVNDEVQVKAEPIDLDEIDEERQMEKMDLMNACRLQPVNQAHSLRDVRINKVIVNPVIVKKTGGKVEAAIRPRAKKTFPQPKRPDGNSELNGKNSMVYIPIQPPNTQQPKKGAVTNSPKPNSPFVPTSAVNTVTTPLRPSTTPSTVSTIASPITVTHSNMSVGNTLPNLGQVSTISQLANMGVGQVPTVGPTTVHTVPLMTSVNGQWMFSLQPVMSVGGVENTTSPPTVNGLPERVLNVPGNITNAMIAPISPAVNRTQNTIAVSPSSTDTSTPEMPRLLQRPLMHPLDAATPIGSVPPPSTAGPLTAKLNQNAVKLTDFFRTLLEDSIEKLDEPLAQVTMLKAQLEQVRWRNQQSLDELKHNHDLTLSEMRQSFEKEKLRVMSEARRAAHAELEAAVKLTKTKQWCANCFQESQFYCCWNTSYCDYSCQRAHWPAHAAHCTQEQTRRQLSPNNRQEGQTLAPLKENIGVANPTLISMLQTRPDVPQRALPAPVPEVSDIIEIPHDETIKQHPSLPAVISKDIPVVKKIHHSEENIKQLIAQMTNKDIGQPEKREIPPQLKSILETAKTRELQKQTPNTSDKDTPESRLQQSDNPPKSAPAAPGLAAIGGKPAPVRVFTDSSGTQKTSIIVSMVEDPSGNPTLKCVGTFKPSAPATEKSSILINKQTNDDSAKKTVTSGGYLIVGASGNTTSVITPAATRRPQIQYFS